jgi:condensation enzyme
MFTIMLSGYYVLAYKLTGNTDLAIRAFTAGRSDPEFHNTMGLFLNCVPFRTDIGDCTSFRDVIVATRDTFIDALTYELPVNVIEESFPDFVKSRENLRTSQFIISSIQNQLGYEVTYPIGEIARPAIERVVPAANDIPSGSVWNLYQLPDELYGSVLFNLDEFDESTVQGWSADLTQILTSAVRDPDQDWRRLADPSAS